MDNTQNFRSQIIYSDAIAFGCSHTWGVGVESTETWPHLLAAQNFGIGSASSDQVIRLARDLVPKISPKIVYCLWPDWSRFEYKKNDRFYQSMPTDPDRIYFMKDRDESWCKHNFAKNIQELAMICQLNQCLLIDMTLYDLIPIIDHVDRWPLSKLGHHYAPKWHQWVADIFLQARNGNLKFALAYE